jgi:hypothetical protein
MQRSRLESILNVAHSENKLSWQLGVGRVRNATSPVLSPVAALLTAILSILRECSSLVLQSRSPIFYAPTCFLRNLPDNRIRRRVYETYGVSFDSQ